MTAHLDPDQLGDLSWGLLDEHATATANAHLQTCEQCRREAAALEDVARTLRGAGDTGPMPEEVANRLDAALRAAASPMPHAENVTPLPVAATRRWWAEHRVLQAAAAVVLVVAGGAIAGPLLTSSGRGPFTASSADRAAPEAGAKADGGSGREAAYGGAALATGTNYTEQTLSTAVSRLLAGDRVQSSPEDAASAKEAVPPGAAGRLADPQALSECIAQLPRGSKATPLLVDVARFEGRDATVIVLPRHDEPDNVDIWVVEPGCGTGNARTLHYQRAPRS
jgi:hypothetical protein